MTTEMKTRYAGDVPIGSKVIIDSDFGTTVCSVVARSAIHTFVTGRFGWDYETRQIPNTAKVSVEGEGAADDESAGRAADDAKNQPAHPLDREATYRERAQKWIEKHPDGFAVFERLALQAMSKGKRFGINLLRERVRWEFYIEGVDDGEDYKFNNNYSPYVARALIKKYPRLADFIETREVRS